jgi:hypothetical protein
MAVIGESGLLAARSRPRTRVHQAVLRREYDTFCVAVMREPVSPEGIGWVQLDREWLDVVEGVSPGMIGMALRASPRPRTRRRPSNRCPLRSR